MYFFLIMIKFLKFTCLDFIMNLTSAAMEKILYANSNELINFRRYFLNRENLSKVYGLESHEFDKRRQNKVAERDV